MTKVVYLVVRWDAVKVDQWVVGWVDAMVLRSVDSKGCAWALK